MNGDPNLINFEWFLRIIYFAIYHPLMWVLDFVNALLGRGGEVVSSGEAYSSLSKFWGIFSIISTMVSLALAAVLIYALIRIRQINMAQVAQFASLFPPVAEDGAVVADAGKTNSRWAHIESLMKEGGENNYRQAILEADIMLGEMLTVQGYHGESIGEQLKMVERADFATLNDAWEAHKVRNRIAHEGSDFILSEDEARRTIHRYQNVFDEFELFST